jgi:hypothetical protein
VPYLPPAEEIPVELILPLVAAGFLVLLAVGFMMGRRDTGTGPNPDSQPGSRR